MIAKLASANPHKLAELRSALPGWRLELLDAHEFPEEEAETYLGNARAKARFGRTVADRTAWILGEDSGLEVAGLGGMPGVHSNRWAGEGEDHVVKLLDALRGVEGAGRRARYVCELVCLSPAGEERRATGTLEGAIATERRGSEGFGYDPVFVPDGETRTVAELGNAWKSRHSHRARAAGDLLSALA
ncbi:MAG: non-canonical purine NTP pyrophosphatase [Gaiellaceae bacterium]